MADNDRLTQLETKMDNIMTITDKMSKFMDFMMDNESEFDSEQTQDISVDHGDHVIDHSQDNELSLQQSQPDVDSDNAQQSSANDCHTVINDTYDTYIQRINKYTPIEQKSPAVVNNLANFVNTTLTKQANTKDIKTITDKYFIPENTPMLVSPKVNIEIWKILPDHVKQKDLSMQASQKKIIQGLVPLVHAMDKAKETEVVNLLQDSFELLANASMSFNLRRRELMKKDMKKAKHLANTNIPITTQLFGDDVEHEFKKIEQTEKLQDTMLASTSKHNFNDNRISSYRRQFWHNSSQNRVHPYKKGQFNSYKQKAKHFLGNTGPKKGSVNYTNRNTQRSRRGRK